jgi:hypothetical protein
VRAHAWPGSVSDNLLQREKEKLLKHRFDLEDQIRVRVKERGRDEMLMSEVEKQLNKKFISAKV